MATLRQQLGIDGPMRAKVEELILAVRKLTEERDRLIALSSDASAERFIAAHLLSDLSTAVAFVTLFRHPRTCFHLALFIHFMSACTVRCGVEMGVRICCALRHMSDGCCCLYPYPILSLASVAKAQRVFLCPLINSSSLFSFFPLLLILSSQRPVSGGVGRAASFSEYD